MTTADTSLEKYWLIWFSTRTSGYTHCVCQRLHVHVFVFVSPVTLLVEWWSALSVSKLYSVWWEDRVFVSATVNSVISQCCFPQHHIQWWIHLSVLPLYSTHKPTLTNIHKISHTNYTPYRVPTDKLVTSDKRLQNSEVFFKMSLI